MYPIFKIFSFFDCTVNTLWAKEEGEGMSSNNPSQLLPSGNSIFSLSTKQLL